MTGLKFPLPPENTEGIDVGGFNVSTVQADWNIPSPLVLKALSWAFAEVTQSMSLQ